MVQKYLKRYADLQHIADGRHQGLIEQGLFPQDVKVANNNFSWTQAEQNKIEQYRQQAAVHAAMVEKIDDNVGKLITALKDSGAYDNTLIFYFSDNGAAAHIGDLMNSPYKGVKALLWEGGKSSCHC
ncbi:sulfatase-like hydrolase/transferase [Paraglaciecola aquimarina]|uniref:Sulfatase-like hydrolase/transferase n=1 Tax=Paraglaciecola aquimarina TaxID=1235557 RepID=A0ABU3SVI1_9ALTE|nr:sulfatase-like hydrolase/transferase [Paraglaciecola aquimarina]MDU0353996.1 sulfatase-like hydrolase/transferase [Paraglaciecola aquimarina]